jgi:lysozyme
MKNIKKIVCAVGVVIAAVSAVYVTEESPQRSTPTQLAPEGNPLRFSQAGMEIIGNAEGCRQDPYLCPANLLTSGVGHAGSDVKATVGAYSMEQITKWFADDLFTSQSCIEKYVEDRLGRQVPQGVFDAFGSFVFNMGCGKFRGYPVYTMLVKGQYKEACNRMLLYTYGGGVKLPGLVARRVKENKLCLAGLK